MSGADLKQRYEACMVLSGAGDALGYNRGNWEFEKRGWSIHEQVMRMGGLEKLNVRDFPVSDDTIMHLATGEALLEAGCSASRSDLYRCLARKYVDCMECMSDRAPGMTCIESVLLLRPEENKGWMIPFNKRGGGCGAAMRAMCIGLRFPMDEDTLVAVSVESGRMTHHHPTGYLGALASALFTAYAVQGKALTEWGQGLLKTLEKAKDYVKECGQFVEENLQHWGYFESHWRDYLKTRGILNGETKAQFPKTYGVEERDSVFKSWSFSGWGGSSGHDAPMIAYDGLLWAGASWAKLAQHSFFHGGDSDSTAAIAAAWWGAVYGYKGVPDRNHVKLEYRDRLVITAQELYKLKDSSLSGEEICTSPDVQQEMVAVQI